MSLAEKNNDAALSALKVIGSSIESKWKTESGLSYGAFAGAKKRLLESGAVVENKDDNGVIIYSVGDAVPLIKENDVDNKNAVFLSEVEEDKTALVKTVSEVRTLAKNTSDGRGKLPKVSEKITGWFNDFDEWETNVRDNLGDVEIMESKSNSVEVILSDGKIQRYRFREDEDGGLIFR